MSVTTIPIVEICSRGFIESQCGASSGMTLNRLAEVCGCFSNEEEDYGCHHPESVGGQCLANECPVAYIDYPEGLTEEECDAYSGGYGDEICMALNDDGVFGERGDVNEAWKHLRVEPCLDAIQR